MKYTPADVSSLGTILGIWAHPDDEAWAMAGITAAACRNGQRVVIVTATKGEAGQTADEAKWPQAQLADIRVREVEEALQIMGVKEHHWLNQKDGQLATGNLTAIYQLVDLIKAIKPDTIISFEPEGITGHADHKVICQWAKAAALQARSDARLLGAIESTEKYQQVSQACPNVCNDVYFNTPHPKTVSQAKAEVYFPLSADLQDIKRRALECQASQMAQLFSTPEGHQFMIQQIDCECFIVL